MNQFVQAKLIDYKTIQVLIYHPNTSVNYIFTLISDYDIRRRIYGTIKEKTPNTHLYEFKLDYEIKLGITNYIRINEVGTYPLDVTELASLPDFDDRFCYDGDDLGCTYSKKATTFAVWAPLASAVVLWLDDKKAFNMIRGDKGVYRLTIEKNLINHSYTYIINNSGIITESIDPYAKASTLNSKASVILDLNSYKRSMFDRALPKMNSYLDAIIYEAHVRDMSIDENTNIVNKGKFLGLCEEGRVNKDNMPVGLDYIKNLGITHLQLLPIFDYYSVDEENPNKSYNWGYDPAQYFVPEGSFASNLNDPSSRIKDLLTLVSKYHENGIRIVMDVVFNHVYEHQYSSLEKIVPNYYFRRFVDGRYFNASGCGNDLATERKMTRKLIIDACKWWVNYYHIDGFRFDLMGLIDIDTMNQLKDEIYKIKPNFIFYGEGWNMFSGYNLTLSNMQNYQCLPCVSFFNDTYRDVVIGNLYDKTKGYAYGNRDYLSSFKNVLLGSAFSIDGNAKFDHVSCSINFVECHDNNTLYDKLAILDDEDNKSRLDRINFINSLVMFSFGIPFFHAGQEIGLSKDGHGNTYNAGDKLNHFDYSLLKDRNFMIEHFKELVKYRKEIRLFHEVNMHNLDKYTTIYELEDNAIKLEFNTRVGKDLTHKKIIIIINPSESSLYYNENNKSEIIAAKSVKVISL